MIKIDIKIDIDQTVEIGECHIEVELSMDKTKEDGHSMIKIIEVTLGEEILEECKITEVRILEVDIQVTLGMITLVEVEVGLEKHIIQVTSGEMREAVVDQDQVQDQVLTGISDTLSVGITIIFSKDCPNISDIEKEQSEQIQQMLNLEGDKTALKVPAADTYKD